MRRRRRASPAYRAGVAAALGWSLFGFVAGIVFWHAVGFWGVVHDAVFSGPRSQLASKMLQREVDEVELEALHAGSYAGSIEVSPVTTGSLPALSPLAVLPGGQAAPAPAATAPAAATPAAPAICGSLSLDRSTGRVVMARCDPIARPIAVPEPPRDDRLETAGTTTGPGAAASSGWSTAVAPGPAPEPSAVKSGAK